MAEKVLMKGNEALAESALRAGCRFFFGYPITPQTELAAYMSQRTQKPSTPATTMCTGRLRPARAS